MNGTDSARRVDRADYAARELKSLYKNEYRDGAIVAMAGGTPEHAAIIASLIGLLSGQLRGKPCRVYSSDLRVHVEMTNRTSYPDLTIVCGELVRDSKDPHAILNPTVIFEVLSESSEAFDRGEKFNNYRCIPSLKEYILVSQTKREVERHVRNIDSSWVLTEWGRGTKMPLEAAACALGVDEVYDGIVA